VSSRIPSSSRSWRSTPSTLLRVPPMEVNRFKHRQLAPTVGPSSRSSGEFEGPSSKSIYEVTTLLSSFRLSATQHATMSYPRRVQANFCLAEFEFHRIKATIVSSIKSKMDSVPCLIEIRASRCNRGSCRVQCQFGSEQLSFGPMVALHTPQHRSGPKRQLLRRPRKKSNTTCVRVWKSI
jgi:hypothetical protein